MNKKTSIILASVILISSISPVKATSFKSNLMKNSNFLIASGDNKSDKISNIKDRKSVV